MRARLRDEVAFVEVQGARGARSAACGSCVTIMMVLPCSRLSVCSRLRISSPDFAIQIAGRFVAQEQCRVGDDGAGDADALLLTARELPRVMVRRVRRGRRPAAPSDVLACDPPIRTASSGAAAARRSRSPSAPAAGCTTGRRSRRVAPATRRAGRRRACRCGRRRHHSIRWSARSRPPIRLSSVDLARPGRTHQRQKVTRGYRRASMPWSTSICSLPRRETLCSPDVDQRFHRTPLPPVHRSAISLRRAPRRSACRRRRRRCVRRAFSPG